jgi:HAE1 family hydrophobic/amphiphilic exporter-1
MQRKVFDLALVAAMTLAAGLQLPAYAQESTAVTTDAPRAATSDDEGIVVPGPAPVPAQDPADPNRPPLPQVRPLRQAPAPEARIGVDESNPMALSLQEAVEMALVRNREIEVERINTQQAGYDVDAAEGVFDPVVNSVNYYDRTTNPVASALAGGASGSVTTSTVSDTLTFQKLFENGGLFNVGAQSVRINSDNIFNAVNPQYQTGLTFTFRQPLLRDFRWNESSRRVKIANVRLDLTDAEFRQRVIETIGQVQRGYWDLEFALRNLQVARESVDLAQAQLGRLQRLVQEGINAPVELVQVEAELERRRESVLAALEGVTVAENALKSLILADRNDATWDRPLVPTDTAGLAPVALTLDEAVATGIANRPELAQLRAQSEINDIDVAFFRNQSKPRVDLFGTYGLAGLAGSPVEGQTSPFSGQNEALRLRINELSAAAGLDPLPAPVQTALPSYLPGGVGSSLGNLFSNDFRSIRVGVEINWNVTNRTAEANLGRSLAEGRKIVVQQQALEQRVEREVRNALQAVQTARQRVDAARAAREAAEVQLASEQRRYDAGLTTTFFVLTRQNELVDARARELQALTDYNKAIVELQRVLGTTLTSNRIDVTTVKEAGSR